MIERNLQNVTIRKYGTAFLEAFGMLPITYFGARGDNQQDNYANLQVAIDESIKRGLRYLFVPDGIYYYTGNLLNVEKITFVGNAEYAKIYDGENEIPIYQIGTQIPYEIGTESLDFEVDEAGYTDISVAVKNGSETILVIDDDVLYVTNGLILLNGALMGDNKVYLDEDEGVYITNIEIIKNAIRIYYDGEGTASKEVEWRVR